MNFNIEKHTILLVLSGSHAYGMSRPESDVDMKGIAIPTKEYFHGYLKHFEQFQGQFPRTNILNRLESLVGRKIPEEENTDSVVYDICKFFRLCADCNPSIIEMLFADDNCKIVDSKWAKLIVENRDLFLSTKAKWTFSGYAFQQLKRINLHRQWLLNPPDHQPTRNEFGLPEHSVMPRDQLMAAESLIKRKIEEWLGSREELPREVLEEIRTRTVDAIKDIWSALVDGCWFVEKEDFGYRIVKPTAPIDRFEEIDEGRISHAAGKLLGYDDNFLKLLDMERGYRSCMKQFRQYEEWKTNRNVARAELESKYGFDCYSDDTEFLTNLGWKKFDEVGDSLLATVNKDFKVEFQAPLEKFDGTFTGNLYNLVGQHIDTLTTPNHRMLFRKVERKSGVRYQWSLEEASNLPDTFEIVKTITPNVKNYTVKNEFKDIPIPKESFLRLMGWYLSDGTIVKENGRIKSVRISQKKGGKLHGSMMKFSNRYKELANCSLYLYERHDEWRKENIMESLLDVRNVNIRNKIVEECGECKNKHIPRWVFGLSKRLMEILLNALCGGDGTKRKHKTKTESLIYYSSCKQLADDVQELAFMCGFETALWGPYYSVTGFGEENMYQVHIRKDVEQFVKFIRKQSVKKIQCVDKRIVCFSVPNSILITRRNGKIGIHGNCKHGSHLVRLMRMCREILENGQVVVKRPDAEELCAIRNGAWTYDQLIEWADNQEKELTEFYNSGKSPLPKVPDHNKIDELCQKIVEEFLGEK